jgi:hypothetical protein
LTGLGLAVAFGSHNNPDKQGNSRKNLFGSLDFPFGAYSNIRAISGGRTEPALCREGTFVRSKKRFVRRNRG